MMKASKGRSNFMASPSQTKRKRKVLPNPTKRQGLKEALEAINKQYPETLAKLAK
jgi:hypothetical protein